MILNERLILSKEKIISVLKEINYPGYTRDIVSFGLVKKADFQLGKAVIELDIVSSDTTLPSTLKSTIEEQLLALEEIEQAEVIIRFEKREPQPSTSNAASAKNNKQPTGPAAQSIQGVKSIIAVASGKGGVGKSTVAANLACALKNELRAQGQPDRVGIMDCDIYGPSIPLMLGINSRPEIEQNKILPIENFGIKVMSMGFLIDASTPVVWRGPMIMKTIQQFAQDVDWGELEVLVVDLPPGTGDAQLSLVQTLPLDGAVIVTTPQSVAASVTQRGARMFEKVNVPIIGVVENMAYLETQQGERNYIFGKEGGNEVAKALETQLLGSIPVAPEISQGCEAGIPIIISHPDSKPAKNLAQVAKTVMDAL